MEKMTIQSLKACKGKRQLIIINIPDANMAEACEEAGVDIIVTGRRQTVERTLSTLPEIRSAAPNTLVTAVMPFESCKISDEAAIRDAVRLLEGGADLIYATAARPVAMMMMNANATITICHTRTMDVPSIARSADIIIAASGQMESVGADYLRCGQIVIDVGIGWNKAKQKLCGDVKLEEAKSVVEAITPVPGGVGSVTTAVLCKHVVEAAQRTLSQK